MTQKTDEVDSTRPLVSAGDDRARTRQDGVDGAEDTVNEVGHLGGGASTEDASRGAADAVEDAAQQVVEQVANGAAGEQALHQAGDGAEQVGQEAQASGLLGGDRAAEDAADAADAAGGERHAADAHGHGLVEAGYGVDEGFHEAVGVGAVLLGELLCGGSVRSRDGA